MPGTSMRRASGPPRSHSRRSSQSVPWPSIPIHIRLPSTSGLQISRTQVTRRIELKHLTTRASCGRLAPRTRERSQQLLSGIVLHKKRPILGAPGKVQHCNQAEQVQPASASHFLAPDMTPPIHAASMIRRLSCAHSSQESVRRRRVTTQGWLAGWLGGSRQADPSLEQGSSAPRTCVRSIEGKCTTTYRPPRHR